MATKNAHVSLRMNSQDKDQLQEQAAQCGLSLSSYILQSALDSQIRVTSLTDRATLEHLGQLRGDLSRCGNLYKLSVSQGQQVHDQALQQLQATIESIDQLLGIMILHLHRTARS